MQKKRLEFLFSRAIADLNQIQVRPEFRAFVFPLAHKIQLAPLFPSHGKTLAVRRLFLDAAG